MGGTWVEEGKAKIKGKISTITLEIYNRFHWKSWFKEKGQQCFLAIFDKITVKFTTAIVRSCCIAGSMWSIEAAVVYVSFTKLYHKSYPIFSNIYSKLLLESGLVNFNTRHCNRNRRSLIQTQLGAPQDVRTRPCHNSFSELRSKTDKMKWRTLPESAYSLNNDPKLTVVQQNSR